MIYPLDYPVVNGGSDKRSMPGVSIFPINIPYSMGSRLELQTELPNHLIVKEAQVIPSGHD